jgi:hypothetical protein
MESLILNALCILPCSCFVLSTYHPLFSYALVVSWHHCDLNFFYVTSNRRNATIDLKLSLTVVLGLVDYLVS